MKYTVPYADSSLDFELLPGMRGTLIESAPSPVPSDPLALVHNALANPLNSPPLEEILPGRQVKQVCIAFTDLSRACPDRVLVPALLQHLDSGWEGSPYFVSQDTVTLLCAVGLHRPITLQEKCIKLGEDVVERCNVVNHNASDPSVLKHVGHTPAGIPIVTNKIALETDLLIATGLVEPHNMAGYSGGAKTLVVGCGGEDTIAATHSVSMLDNPKMRLGRTADNPFQQAVRAGGRAIGLDFVLNAVLDGEGRIVAAAAGEPEAVHDHLVAFARGIYETPIDRQFDVAIAGVGGAKDANIYQATRAATYLYYAPTPVVRKGGIIIVPTRCPDGVGEGVGELRFFEALRDAPDIPTLVDDLHTHGYPAGVQRTYLVARALADLEFVLAGTVCPDEVVRDCKMIPVDSIQEGLEYARRRLGPDLDVAIVPHALQTLPILAD